MRGMILCPICHQTIDCCTHNHGMAYTVVNLTTQERGRFREAWDVAMFMWGRDFTRYRIFKRGALFSWSDGNLAAMKHALEAA